VDQKGNVLKRIRCVCTRESLARLVQTEFTKPDQVALETTTNAWAVADLIQPHVGRVVVNNLVKTRIIADARINTDQVEW
jgi:transposase